MSSSGTEQAKKRPASTLESFQEDEGDSGTPLKKFLLSFNRTISNRLDTIENRLENISDFCHSLEEQVDVLSTLVRENSAHAVFSAAGSPGSISSSDENSMNSTAVPSAVLGSSVTVIALNSEADYPNGSWLGDETNPKMRVRCHISPTDLFHINTTCTTPEKMALTLMDYLFDRETQATSNISGAGKHKKKQLDPLLIYGIRCHLIEKFNISTSDWHRIKQNMDSKCRTAFRRKVKGLPLTPKHHRISVVTVPTTGLTTTTSTTATSTTSTTALSSSYPTIADCEPVITMSSEGDISDAGSIDFGGQRTEFQGSFHILPVSEITGDASSADVSAVVDGAQVIQANNGEIRVMQATPEHLAQIQQTHQIQVLTSGHLLATPVTDTIASPSESSSSANKSSEDNKISGADRQSDRI